MWGWFGPNFASLDLRFASWIATASSIRPMRRYADPRLLRATSVSGWSGPAPPSLHRSTRRRGRLHPRSDRRKRGRGEVVPAPLCIGVAQPKFRLVSFERLLEKCRRLVDRARAEVGVGEIIDGHECIGMIRPEGRFADLADRLEQSDRLVSLAEFHVEDGETVAGIESCCMGRPECCLGEPRSLRREPRPRDTVQPRRRRWRG